MLEQLRRHPGLTATELARAFGLAAEPYKQLAALQQRALVVSARVWNPDQGRQVMRWHVAPPGTVPPPRPAPDPDAHRRRLERDRKSQAARRARARELTAVIGAEGPSLRDLWAAGSCRSADPDLFFGPDAEFVTARRSARRRPRRSAPGARSVVPAWPTRWTAVRRTASGVA